MLADRSCLVYTISPSRTIQDEKDSVFVDFILVVLVVVVEVVVVVIVVVPPLLLMPEGRPWGVCSVNCVIDARSIAVCCAPPAPSPAPGGCISAPLLPGPPRPPPVVAGAAGGVQPAR